MTQLLQKKLWFLALLARCGWREFNKSILIGSREMIIIFCHVGLQGIDIGMVIDAGNLCSYLKMADKEALNCLSICKSRHFFCNVKLIIDLNWSITQRLLTYASGCHWPLLNFAMVNSSHPHYISWHYRPL